MPDIEQTIWKPYRQRLDVIGVDPDNNDLKDGDGVHEFCQDLGITFPVGLELTTTYELFLEDYEHRHPYPLDILIDAKGNIRYVSREYDPVALQAAVQEVLEDAP